jgi:hypothetical protein
MKRLASCACGQLKVETEGEPDSVVACNCLACQRRSGSPFGLGAYWTEDKVRETGVSRTFVRAGESGHTLTNHFCPDCGSTVWWTPERDPGRVGVAVGAFGDPGFKGPDRSVWDVNKHGWVEFPDDVPGFLTARNSERTR